MVFVLCFIELMSHANVFEDYLIYPELLYEICTIIFLKNFQIKLLRYDD